MNTVQQILTVDGMWGRIDPLHRDALWAEFDKLTAESEYVDNRRVCRLHDPVGMVMYADAKDSGCCGSVDVFFDVDGETYCLGYNYGH